MENQRPHKIKDIYIKLNNYRFEHSQIDTDDKSANFIGRFKILDKIKNLITNSIINKGTYLITGQRGTGKTSVVNKAFNELCGTINLLSVINPIIFTCFLWLFSNYTFTLGNIEDFTASNLHAQKILLTITLIFLVSFCLFHYIRLKYYPDKISNLYFTTYILYILSLFVLWRGNDKLLFKVIYITILTKVLIYSYGRIKNILFTKNSIFNTNLILNFTKFLVVLPLFLFILTWAIINVPIIFVNNWKISIIIILSFSILYTLIHYSSTPKIVKLEKIIKYSFYDTYLRYWKNSNLLKINVNLGQTNLKQIDILRIIVNNTYFAYYKWVNSYGYIKKFIKIIFILILYLIICQTYYKVINEDIKKLYYSLKIYQIYPTFIFSSNDSLKVTLNEINNENDLANIKSISLESINNFDKFRNTYIKYISSKPHNYQLLYQKITNDLTFEYILFKKYFSDLKKYNDKISNTSKKNKSYNFENNIFYSEVDTLQKEKIINYKDSLFKFYIFNQISLDTSLQSYVNLLNNNYFISSHLIAKFRQKFDCYLHSELIKNKMYFEDALEFSDNSNHFLYIPYTFLQTIDYNIFYSFNHFKTTFPILKNFPNYYPIKNLSINYFIIIFLLLFYIVFHKYLITRIKWLETNHRALAKLNELNKRIQGDIALEQRTQVGINTFRFPFFIKSKKHDFEKLDEIGIQNYLIDFLETVDKIPAFFFKPKIIYVLDELDKIDPYIENNNDKEKNMHELAKVLSSRKRQEFIIHTLSSMKYFFTTATAKFIFIAGYEMYEAALSSVSDRENQVEGLFSQVINISSFYTDDSDGRSNDITSMCEQFVLNKFKFKNNQYTLNQLYIELKEKENFKDNEAKRLTLIMQNFITYLTYRSNGSPKKLKTLMEECITSIKNHNSNNINNSIVINKIGHGDYYLVFNHYSQYKHALIASLFMPYLMSVSQYIHEMSDKLLVSTSYIMDHIYKFHNNAFAWRHLEVNPELIAFNKTPELRKFLNDILIHLSKNHIKEINNGLFDYKFTKKMQSEINFISRISEKESAAFNFTMDQNLDLKKYYIKKLFDFNSIANSQNNNELQHNHSISYINMVLGDLHYYDQEYDDAILYYSNAIQILRNQNPQNIIPYNTLVLTRNMLKLGLCFERKKIFDSALAIYAQIAHQITVSRSILLDKFKLQEFKIYNNELNIFFNKFTNSFKRLFPNFEINNNLTGLENIKSLNDYLATKNKSQIENFNGYITIIGNPSRINETLKYNIENNSMKIESKIGSSWSDLDDIFCFKEHFFENNNSDLIFSSEKSEMFVKINLDEHLRITTQAILARLVAIEKVSLHGITQTDLNKAIEEFNFIIRPINEQEKPLIRINFNFRLANILFYKFMNSSQIIQCNPEHLYREAICSIINNKIFFDITFTIQNDKHFNKKILIYANKIVSNLFAYKINLKTMDKEILIFFECISAYSNCLYVNHDPNKLSSEEELKLILQKNICSFESTNFLFSFNLQLLCKNLYHYFGFYYHAYSSSLRLLYMLSNSPIKNLNLTTLELIKKEILNEGIKHIHQMYEHSNRIEYIKFRQTFGIAESYTFRNNFEIYNSSSGSSEVKEIIIIYYNFILKSFSPSNTEYQNAKLKIQSTFNEESVLGKFNLRLLEYRLVSKVNFDFIKDKPYNEMLLKKYKDYDRNENPIQADCNTVSKFLNAIYTCSEIIKISNIYGINYINITHSTIANAYENLAILLEALFLHNKNIIEEVKKSFNELCGIKENYIFNPWFHYEKAIEKYHDVLSFHNQGLIYKEFLQNQFYLEDDLNDGALHFCVSFERQKTQSNLIQNKIKFLKEKLDGYELYGIQILDRSVN